METIRIEKFMAAYTTRPGWTDVFLTQSNFVFFPEPDEARLLRTVLTRWGGSLKKKRYLPGAYGLAALWRELCILISRWFGVALSAVDAMTYKKPNKSVWPSINNTIMEKQ